MVEEEAEATEGLTVLEANEKLMARLLEYKGSTQLISMRAIMAKSFSPEHQASLGLESLPTKSSG
jgi:hypothetical protein